MPKPNSDCRVTERKHPWPMVRLGDVCTIEFGTRVRRKDSQGGDYPVYGGGGATFCWSTYNREDQCIVSRFAMSEECVRFVKGKFFLNDSGLSVRSDNQDLSQTYLDWVLYSKQPEIYALGRGAAQKNLDVEQFVDMMLPLPPLSVQREIVARLERELAAVEKMKKGFETLAETAKAEFKAELKEVFEEISRGGAETRRLGEIGRVAMCKRVLKAQTSDNGDVPFFKIGTFGKEPNAYISNGLFREFTKKFSYPKKGDVLISAAGTIGRTIVFDGKPSYFQDSNIVWLEHDGTKVTNEYLHCFYWSKPWKVSDGATIPRIYNGDIESVEIPLPSLPVQRQIVARLDSAKARAEKLEAKAREGVAVCETMRKAILKEAFDDGRASPAIGKATGR